MEDMSTYGEDKVAAEFPCALIDVRDLANWVITAAEQNLDGAFNATGPTTPFHEVLTAAPHVANSAARPRPVRAAVLAEQAHGQTGLTDDEERRARFSLTGRRG